MMGTRRDRELPTEWKLLFILREVIGGVVPYQPSPQRVVCYYFKRADPGQITGQYHPRHRIEVCAILKTGNEMGLEVGRETNIFDSEEKVAEHIRNIGYVAHEHVVTDGTVVYPYFKGLKFFNEIVPRPSWLDETVQQEAP